MASTGLDMRLAELQRTLINGARLGFFFHKSNTIAVTNNLVASGVKKRTKDERFNINFRTDGLPHDVQFVSCRISSVGIVL